MKRFGLFWGFLFFIVLTNISKTGSPMTNGEFWIVYDNPGGTSMSVTMTSLSYAWRRDSNNNSNIISTTFSSGPFYLSSTPLQKSVG